MTGSTDVFFGGLPPIASFAEVEKAIHAVGDDVLRFQFRQECGYGVIRFSNAEAATKACQLLNQVRPLECLILLSSISKNFQSSFASIGCALE